MVLSSIEDVGRTKAVGYLPLYTVANVLLEPLDDIVSRYKAKQLRVKVIGENKTCIKGGALFVYDKNMFKRLIIMHKTKIIEKGWKQEIEYIMNKISKHWYENNDPIMSFIRELYGDTS